jgi:integral membrane sensor domain MASE1
MIQRIQSVFLFLLAVAVISMLFLPLWSKSDVATGETVVLTAFNINSYVLNTQGEPGVAGSIPSKSSMAIGLLAIAAAVIAVFEIFKFRNRLTQMKLGLLNTLVLAALLGTTFYYAAYVTNEMVAGTDNGTYHSGFYMPIVALLLNALSNRFIKRDEDLVRSADRLR